MHIHKTKCFFLNNSIHNTKHQKCFLLCFGLLEATMQINNVMLDTVLEPNAAALYKYQALNHWTELKGRTKNPHYI